MSAKTSMKDIQPIVQKVIYNQIDILKKVPEDSALALANQHILNNFNDDASVWAAGGTLEAAGVAYYIVKCDLLLTNATSIKAVDFSAHGWGAVAAVLECEVVGAFVVDPSTVGGKCKWVITAGAVEEGAVSLTLLTESGKLIGTFLGNADGIGVFTWSKKNGELKVKKA